MNLFDDMCYDVFGYVNGLFVFVFRCVLQIGNLYVLSVLQPHFVYSNVYLENGLLIYLITNLLVALIFCSIIDVY